MADFLRHWLSDHDNKVSFTLLYVGLSVFLSIYISLFWLIPIVAAHAALEAFTLPKETPHKTIHVLLHLKLDIVLIIFALWLAVYFESIFGLLGLSAASRTAAQGGARFLAWQKSIKGALMTVDDAAQLARGVMRVRSKADVQEDTENNETNESLGRFDWLIIGTGVAMLLGIALAPFIIDASYNDVLNILADELTPIP